MTSIPLIWLDYSTKKSYTFSDIGQMNLQRMKTKSKLT